MTRRTEPSGWRVMTEACTGRRLPCASTIAMAGSLGINPAGTGTETRAISVAESERGLETLNPMALCAAGQAHHRAPTVRTTKTKTLVMLPSIRPAGHPRFDFA